VILSTTFFATGAATSAATGNPALAPAIGAAFALVGGRVSTMVCTRLCSKAISLTYVLSVALYALGYLCLPYKFWFVNPFPWLICSALLIIYAGILQAAFANTLGLR